MGSRKTGRPKTQKPCARWPDADRNRRSASGDPAMVLVFRMASIFRVVTGTVPVTPAAEMLLDVVRLSMIFQEKPISTSPQSCPSRRIVFSKIAKKAIVNDHAKGALERDDFPSNRHPTLSFCLSMIFFRKPVSTFPDHALGGARTRTSSTTNVVLLDQHLVTRLVRLLEIVEKRTARRHELQETAARMVVLDVALDVPGEIVDAFRQDRDLNLGRAGVAGLGGICLDDFRFAFGGNRHRQILSLRPELAVSPVRLNTRLGMSSPLPISASARRRPATVT